MIPAERIESITKRFGDEGRDWISAQTKILEDLCHQWGVNIVEPFLHGHANNCVYAAEQDGAPVVLKTGYPDPELFTEVEMLKLWRGRAGCVQLIECDELNGVMLMHRVQPGSTFRDFPVEDRSVQIPELHRTIPVEIPTGVTFPSYLDWCQKAFVRCTDKTMLSYIELAKPLIDRFWIEESSNWLLHGDLHHDNMLSDGQNWIAIDPKGVTGPRLFEYGRFMHNFMSDEAEGEAIQDVLQLRAESLRGEFSANELLLVGFIDLTLAITWTVNSGGTLRSGHQELIAQYADLIKRITSIS